LCRHGHTRGHGATGSAGASGDIVGIEPASPKIVAEVRMVSGNEPVDTVHRALKLRRTAHNGIVRAL
jgi:hypothetical protein